MSRPPLDVAVSLALSRVPGLGPIGYARLVERFGSASAVLAAGPARLAEEGLVRPALADAVSRARPGEAERRLIRWAEKEEVRILPLEDPAYPARLAQIPDPPPVLYVKGNGLAACEQGVGVVGSRWISHYGRQATREVCGDFARAGICVISGMALGVDGVAHQAALDSGGVTVAVLGTGLDQPYPPEHGDLFARIAASGAVVTEYPPGTRPLGANFPKRNRIISGLSLGVVVVEAKRQSGSLITARLAAEQGREVYAVPGNLGQEGSEGTNRLIRQGATLITSAADVVGDLLPQLAATLTARPAAPEVGVAAVAPFAGRILEALGNVPVSVDVLADRLGVDAPPLIGALLEMELTGLVEKLPGNRYIRPPQTIT